MKLRSIISLDGRGVWGEWIYVWVSPFLVKLSHYQSAIPQYKVKS